MEPAFAALEEAQLEVLWAPLPHSYPADHNAEEGFLCALPAAYAFVQSHLDAGRNVLVHRSWGEDRTGLLLAYHLIQIYGLAPSAAIARVREVRPRALSAAGWEPMATM